MSNFIPRVIDNITTETEYKDGSMIFDKSDKKIYFDFDSQHQEVKSGVEVPVIDITNLTVVASGKDPVYQSIYITLSTLEEQRAFFIDEKYTTIKIDASARYLELGLPAPYFWLKRNVEQSLLGYTGYQFSIDGASFNYGHYITDNYISMIEIGNAAVIFDDAKNQLYFTMQSINPTIMWSRIGSLESSKVTANPTEEATDTLSKIKVGPTTYNIGGGSDVLEPGFGLNSIQSKELNYIDLVNYFVTKTGASEAEVKALLAQCGITETLKSYNYGIASLILGAGLTNGTASNSVEGAFNFATGLKSTFSVNNFTDISAKQSARQTLINWQKNNFINTGCSESEIIAGAADSYSVALGTLLGTVNADCGSNNVKGTYNTVLGYGNIIEGQNTCVTGNQNSISADNSFVSGFQNFVKGVNNSLIVGYENNIAMTDDSFKESIIAAGRGLTATDTSLNAKAILGRFNTEQAETLLEIGNGTADTNRQNAFEVYNDGKVKFNALTDGSTTKTITEILAGGGNSLTRFATHMDSVTHEQWQTFITAVNLGTIKGNYFVAFEREVKPDLTKVYDIIYMNSSMFAYYLPGGMGIQEYTIGTSSMGDSVNLVYFNDVAIF